MSIKEECEHKNVRKCGRLLLSGEVYQCIQCKDCGKKMRGDKYGPK